MTITSKSIPAEEVQEGCFIYIEDEFRFFYVDEVIIEEDGVTFVFEPSINVDDWQYLEYAPDEMIVVPTAIIQGSGERPTAVTLISPYAGTGER